MHLFQNAWGNVRETKKRWEREEGVNRELYSFKSKHYLCLPLENEIYALTQTIVAWGVYWGLLCEVCVELRDIVVPLQGWLKRRLQLPVNNVRPVDVLEVRVLLDRIRVGQAGAQSLTHLSLEELSDEISGVGG